MKPLLAILAALVFLPMSASAVLPIAYDANVANPNPTTQGWIGEEIVAGSDRNGDGLIDSSWNVGPVDGPTEGTAAWQIHDQLTNANLNVPGYTRLVSADEQDELLAKGWVFTARVKIERHGTGATWDSFVSWGLTNFMGAERRVGFAVGSTGNVFFAREDTAGPTVALGANSRTNYHTITAYGRPGSSVYDWYINGNLAGTRDLLTNTVAQGSIVRFFSGSSPLLNAAANWLSVSLEAWTPKDVVASTTVGSAQSFPRWVPPVSGFTYVITPRASSGNILFSSAPTVDAAGTLRFTLAVRATGTATFDVATPHGTVPFRITANHLVAGFHPHFVRSYQASTYLTRTQEVARIRVWRQPPGERRGIAILLNGFSPTKPSFASPASEKTNVLLSGFAKVPYSEGFDVWDVHWHDPRACIEDNAMIVQELLRDLAGGGFNLDPGGTDFLETLTPMDKVVLAGGSMGGLVGRFALCHLERSNIPHRCDLFLSVDSPQDGANIPVGLQRMARYLHALPAKYKTGADATLLQTVLDTFDQPAAREMLVMHHSGVNGAGAVVGPALERRNFTNLLHNLGNWPTNPGLRLAAFANGRGDGKLQDGNASRDTFNLPKPGGYQILDWSADRRVVSDITRWVNAPGCFVGTLRLRIQADLRMRAYSTDDPVANPGASTIFQAGTTLPIEVWGTEYDIFSNATDVVHHEVGVIDTAGTANEVTVRLREWIKDYGFSDTFPSSIACDIFLVNNGLDAAISTFIDQLVEAESLKQTYAASGNLWDYVPGAWRTTGRFAAGALGSAGTVAQVNDYHTFIPTVSALGLSGFVSPYAQAIPPGAVTNSPFDALYHFGAHGNTGHVQDYDDWLSDVIVHELRLLTGQVRPEIHKLPQSIGWHGLYRLEESPDLSSGWLPRAHLRHGVHALPQPPPAQSFFRLSFPPVYE